MKNAIYGVISTCCDMICMGQKVVALSSRFSKHRYDVKNCPDNSDIAEHFHTGHQDCDMKVFLLQTGLSLELRRRAWIPWGQVGMPASKPSSKQQTPQAWTRGSSFMPKKCIQVTRKCMETHEWAAQDRPMSCDVLDYMTSKDSIILLSSTSLAPKQLEYLFCYDL